MNRRQFVQNLGLCGAVGLSGLSFNTQAKTVPGYKLGYQLYSARDEMSKDPIKTLEALKAMGYQDFEIYGYDAQKQLYYGMPAAEFKQVLDTLGLSVSSGHYWFATYLNSTDDDIKWFVDRCIAGALAIGSRYITWPKITEDQISPQTYKRLPALLNRIGQQVNDAGLTFAYHNHGYEFEYQDKNGNSAYDIIVNQTDPDLVKLQMDMYWVMHSSKTTPKALVEKHAGRYELWHIKDMDSVTRDYTELGNGSINYKNVLPDTKQSGLNYFYIEQGGNFAVSQLASAAQSAQYFKTELARHFVKA